MTTTDRVSQTPPDPQQAERNRLHRLFKQAPGFMCVLQGPDHVYELANDAYYQLVGHREIIGRGVAEVLPEIVDQGFLTRLDEVFASGSAFVGRAMPIRLQRVAGGAPEQRYVDLIYQPILDHDRRVTGIFVQGHDVTDAHVLAQEVSYQAAHDALTGLSNRHEFSRIGETLTGGPHALLYMDIDHFKIVNDRCGHAAGDALLREVASALTDAIRPGDLLGRLGGDEFALLRQDCTLSDMRDLADALRQAVRDIVFVWEGRRYGITLSIGAVLIGPCQALPFARGLGLADAACFLAKDQGRNRVQLAAQGDASINRQQRDMDDATRLKQALAEDRITLWAQRITAFRGSGATEGPDFYEILARLIDSDGTLVQPASFIPAAERFGLIEELDLHIIRQAFRHLEAQGQEAQGRARRVTYFINLSSLTLGMAGFADVIDTLLRAHPGVDPSQICFEVTESAAVARIRRTAAAMRRLTARGIRFALDDFGSGMASFTYLRQLPVQFVKIDGAFVRALLEDETSAIIVESVIRVARSMNMATIAEYVETEHLLPVLRDLGADYGQGYALHRPEPLARLHGHP